MKKYEPEFILKLVQHAQKDAHSEFKLIENKYMYRVVLKFKTATGKVIKLFERASKNIMKAYKKNVNSGQPVYELVSSMQVFVSCILFYKKENEIATKMLKEYKNYLNWGHRFWSMIGGQRPEELMFEHTSEFIDIFEDL